MTIRCSQGHANPDTATFCDECGEPLPASTSASAANLDIDEPTVPSGPAAPQPTDNEAPTQAASHPPATDEAPTVAASAPAPDQAETAAAQSAPAPDQAETAVASSAPAAPPSAPAAPDQAAPAPAPSMPAPAPVAAQPRLLVEGTEATFDLAGKTSVVLGREDIPSNSFPDVDLTPYGAEEGGVSRLHAHLTQSGESWNIEDLDSTNFTFVNRKRIPPKTPTPLNDGDEIRLGRVGLRFKTTA